MSVATRSQTMQREGNWDEAMEARLAKKEETIKKLTEETETLRRTNEELVGGGEPSSNEQVESRHVPTNAMAEEERRKMHL